MSASIHLLVLNARCCSRCPVHTAAQRPELAGQQARGKSESHSTVVAPGRWGQAAFHWPRAFTGAETREYGRDRPFPGKPSASPRPAPVRTKRRESSACHPPGTWSDESQLPASGRAAAQVSRERARPLTPSGARARSAGQAVWGARFACRARGSGLGAPPAPRRSGQARLWRF